MEVIWIEEVDGFAVYAPACRHFEFKVFMRDVFLLVVHSIRKKGAYTRQSDDFFE